MARRKNEIENKTGGVVGQLQQLKIPFGRKTKAFFTGRKTYTKAPEMGLANVEWVVVDEADVMFNPDFQEYTRMLLADIALARGVSVPFNPTSDLNPLGSETPYTPLNYPFNLILTSATIPSSLAHRIAHPARVARGLTARQGRGHLSKVADLSEFLEEKGIKHVALAGGAEARKRGSDHHLDGFLRVETKALAIPTSESGMTPAGPVPPRARRRTYGRRHTGRERPGGGVWEDEEPFQRAKDVRKKVGALKA
ncbi:hypothetical protein FIBSPDRAFT_879233 [Athelia psychrophila]|uniref:Uncharacterized protein n=1 Tax=Athelia psychrophila TaxID=1759441 RepID=A0A167U7X5_9AGAM|nr:hypothetical protein FIBSPDRAFT_879233 [Fibularhizoctonia sp. CBS 109695]